MGTATIRLATATLPRPVLLVGPVTSFRITRRQPHTSGGLLLSGHMGKFLMALGGALSNQLSPGSERLRRIPCPLPSVMCSHNMGSTPRGYGDDASPLCTMKWRPKGVLLLPRMQAMLQFFSAEHLDPGKVINKRPQILQMDTKKLASNLLFLQLLPIKVWKGVESRPELLYFPCHIIQTKLDALTHLGFVLKRFPALISLDLEAVRRRIAFLQHLGLDSKHIVNKCFTVFGPKPFNPRC